jgi:hypothetical protein
MAEFYFNYTERDQLEQSVDEVIQQKGGYYIMIFPISEKDEWNGAIITPSLDSDENTIVDELAFQKMTGEEEKFIITKTIHKLAKYLLKK